MIAIQHVEMINPAIGLLLLTYERENEKAD